MMLAIVIAALLFAGVVLFMMALRQAEASDAMESDYYVGVEAAHPIPDVSWKGGRE